jgi:hypothetical protein
MEILTVVPVRIPPYLDTIPLSIRIGDPRIDTRSDIERERDALRAENARLRALLAGG